MPPPFVPRTTRSSAAPFPFGKTPATTGVANFPSRNSTRSNAGPPKPSATPSVNLLHETERGRILLGDSLGFFGEEIEPGEVDLIMTSPPIGQVGKKDYGNVL